MKNFTVNKFRFCSDIDSRTGTPYITKISPYDMTKYHWARKVQSTDDIILWNVFRNGKCMGTISFDAVLNEQSELEAVALKLLQYDDKAKLIPRIDRT